MPTGIYQHKRGVYHHSDETKNKIGISNSIVLRSRRISPKTEIKKGQRISPSTEFKKGRPSPRKGKKYPQFSGSNSPRWKGGYDSEHCKKVRRFNQKLAEQKRRTLELNANGSHTLAEWENLKAQYNWTCPCCKRKEPEIKLTEDHIVPLTKGGSNNIENIQPLCHSCNSKKHIKIIKYE